jgi:FtsP/CotA-like multicopper oxidase with cupredoxin domain
MNRRSHWLPLIGSSLLLASGGTALASGIAGSVTSTSGTLELAQGHEHGHVSSRPAAQPEHQPPLDPKAPASQRQQQHMMMPHAPMQEMPSRSMMHGSTAAEMGGHDMSPVDVSRAAAAGPEARGGQLLQPAMQGGLKEFELSTGVVRWSILPDVEVGAYAYNGQVPGPLIRVEPGDRIRVRVRNDLPNATTVHWHGLIVPIEQDGVPEISHPPIPVGGEHSYEFDVPDTLFLPHALQRRPSAAARALRRVDHR